MRLEMFSIPLSMSMVFSITQALIVATLYPQTPAEIAAGVTPVNFQYPPYTVDRYGSNATPGTTDMYLAIQNANNAAAEAGAAVIFQPGEVYGVNVNVHAAGLTMTASWVCNGPSATVLRTDTTVTTAYFFVAATGVNNLVLRGLIFDGQVTTIAAAGIPNVDLGAVGSYGDNGTESLWTKSYGVLFRSTQNCIVEDCVFQNFLRAGLRFDTGNSGGPVGPPVTPPIPPYASGAAGDLSLHNIVSNCRSQRTRGIYGDGFLAVDTESMQWSNCYAYDYQRIGFSTDFTTAGEMGMQYSNCTAEFGHDAVSPQSNVGFWIEVGDGVSYTNCESKSTSVGFEFGSAASAAAGVWRPYTGSVTYSGCRAVRSHSAGFKSNLAQRDTHVVMQGCFAEVNASAATYSASVGIGANAYQLSFAPASGGPNGTAAVSCHYEIRGCRADMVDMSSITTAAAFNCFNGTVTNAQQLTVIIDGLSTKWLTTAGANDTGAITAYESTTAPNYGYFGDIVFSGVNNGGTAFSGFAKVLNCTNETGGYVMLSSEFTGGNGVLEIVNTRVSMRTGGVTSNGNGTLNISDCDLVDMRGQLGWSSVTISGSNIADADSSNTDRTTWGPNTTFFQLSNCFITRQLRINGSAGSSSSHRLPCAMFTGCTWKLKYQTEPGLYIFKTTGDYTTMFMSGCAFIDTGSTSTTNAMIFVSSGDTDFYVAGAGNAFDANLINVASGHVVTVDATSYDAPQTASGIYITVFGTVAIPLS